MKQVFNLAEHVLETASRYPDRVAFRGPLATRTHGHLRDSVLGYAARMRDLGIGQSSRICITSTNVVAQIQIMLACALLGCSWVRGTLAARQGGTLDITHFINDGRSTPEVTGRLLEIDRSWLPQGSIDAESFEGFASADSIYSILQSSGTTGQRKFMTLSASAQMRRFDRHSSPFDDLGGRPPLTYSFMSPMASFGIEYLFKSLILGGAVAVSAKMDFLIAAGVTTVIASPGQYLEWCRRFAPPRTKIPCAVISGARCSDRLFDLLFERFETVQYQYGCAELGDIALHLLDRDSKNRESVGKLLPSVEVQIVDADDQPQPRGTKGILRVRTDTPISSYIGGGATGPFRDGWFYTGDIAVLSAEGGLTISGRTNELVNMGGIKIDANALDDVVMATDGVKDGAAFTQSGFSPIEELAVMIVLNDPTQTDAVVARVRANIVEKFGAPATVQRCYIVDEIHRNENGKIARHLLVELAANMTPFAPVH